jgi:hypothetical protein
MSWRATDAGLATTKPSSAGATAAAADGAVAAVGRGRSVARWVKEAVGQVAAFDDVAAESEGRDVDDEASDTAAAAADEEVETVEEEAVEPSLLLLPSLSPAAAVPVAMQSRGRSFILE